MGIEIRESSQVPNGVGVFATREYAVGEVILREEAPLARLAPRDHDMEEQMILDNLMVKTAANPAQPKDTSSRLSLRECIGSLPTVVVDKGPSWEAKFRAMIQAALCFVHLRPMLNEDELLKLYHPNLEDEEKCSENERTIVETAQLALKYLEKLVKPESALERVLQLETNNKLLLKVMLIWACNAFEGGRVYHQISRINHSCNPNAKVFVTDDNNKTTPSPSEEGMTIRTVTRVRAGDEISISYLDTMLYAGALTRRKALQRDKFLDCACVRCQQERPDAAAAIPCPECHPRQPPGGRQLEEDVQYDDEQTVHYACPIRDSDGQRIWKCETCQWSDGDTGKDSTTAKIFATSRSAVVKVINFLQDHESRKIQSQKDSIDDDDEDADNLNAEQLEQHLRLASSVLGARHWTTNILLWIQLDQTLQDFHGRLLDSTESDDHDDTVMETIAECMDQLERVCRFFDGLGLHLHRGHWLSDVIVGCARALVSLGDAKSQKFAAETLDKYLSTGDSQSPDDNFVDLFETEGMQAVVYTLKNAWKRNGNNSNGGDGRASERPEKRAKR